MSNCFCIISPNIFGAWCTYFCEQLFSIMKRKVELRNIRMNRYQCVTNNDSNMNTVVKSEMNKLSTNKGCQVLADTVPVNGTSEQNPNGYCNIDFVYTLAPNKCFLYLWHHDTFWYHEFMFILECITPHFRSLNSLSFEMRSICYLPCNTSHSG